MDRPFGRSGRHGLQGARWQRLGTAQIRLYLTAIIQNIQVLNRCEAQPHTALNQKLKDYRIVELKNLRRTL